MPGGGRRRPDGAHRRDLSCGLPLAILVVDGGRSRAGPIPIGHSPVPGLYAAGYVVRGLDPISHAMGQGGVASTMIRNDPAAERPLLRPCAAAKA